ncbi:hypothetical protein GF337_08665, partial [candidate division KSB1 bacterium]|nr:hypothetical protein [candidate division KSB1 bacterium]
MKNIVIYLLFITGFVWGVSAKAMISPVRRNESGKPLLFNCNDIRLVKQEIDLYHHPVGIWIVTCTSQLRNLTPKIIKQEVGFPAGWDIIQFDDS